jgi:uncharacterized protein (DUF952 family)
MNTIIVSRWMATASEDSLGREEPMASVYRVVALRDWVKAQKANLVPLSHSDEQDGYVHLSQCEDVETTANLYFDVEDAPLAMEIDAEALGEALVWEAVVSRGNRPFPHLYAPGIPMHAVRATHTLEHGSTGFALGQRTTY